MAWTESFFAWLICSALASLLVLGIGGVAAFACRQPARRLRIIELTLAGCLIVPWLGMIPGYPRCSIAWRYTEAPAATVEDAPRVSSHPTASADMAMTTDSAPLTASGSSVREDVVPANESAALPAESVRQPSAEEQMPATAAGESWDLASWVVAFYLTGVGIGVLWWLTGVAALLRIVGTAQPAPTHCRRALERIAGWQGERVRLLTSRVAKQPFALAWGPSLIVLPEDVCRDDQAARWALAHEWTHIERRDFPAWLAADLVRVLFFYQPLVWWLRRQLRLCQDYVADAGASRESAQPEDYAEFLAQRAAAGSLHPAIVALGMGFRKSELYRRVVMLVQNPPLESRPPRLWTTLAVLAAIVMVGLVSALSITSEIKAQEEKKPVQVSESPLKKVDFVVGPNKCWGGDKITIEEVRSKLGTLGKGDTITVKGSYVLASRPRATLSLYVTQDANDPPDYNPGVSISAKAGTHSFEMKRTITCKGHLHFTFYSLDSGRDFGTVYFGTAAQMKEIADWKEWVEKPGKPDSPQARQTGPFSAEFPDGTTVELVGVSPYPSAEKSWWRPDGSPLAERPYERLQGTLGGTTDKYVAREIAVRVTQKDAGQIGTSWRLDPPCTAKAAAPTKPTSDQGVTQGFAFLAPANQKTVAFQFGVASGNWEPFGEATGNTSLRLHDGTEIAFFGAFEKNGDVVVPIATNITGVELRVIAVGNDGRKHDSKLMQAEGGKINQLVASFPKTSLKEIKAFQLQGRRYQWIAFCDVSLNAGRKTDVKVVVPCEPRSPESPASARPVDAIALLRRLNAAKQTPPGVDAIALLERLNAARQTPPVSEWKPPAWQETDKDKYTAPNFEAFFPDDRQAGARLDGLFESRAIETLSDDAILSAVRSGLRHADRQRTSILRWLGNRYIWGKSPQNPQAIEIMYHAADFSGKGCDAFGTRHFAVYFGLSVVQPKTPAILRTLADLCMKVDDPNDLGRAAWGVSSQKAEAIEYLKPYLASLDVATRAKAQVVEQLFAGRLDAFKWATDKAVDEAKRDYTSELPRFKKILEEGTSKERYDLLCLVIQKRILRIMDDSYTEALEKCAQDEDDKVRKTLTAIVGEEWIWRQDKQRPKAIELLLRLTHDDARDVRYAAVYYGLSTVRNKDEKVVRRLLELAFEDREPNLYGRIAWGLRDDRAKAAEVLLEYLNGDNAEHAKAAREIFKDMTGREPPGS
jgi:beta-lactamase regulating signal transducer with metallopeptidase domain